MFPNLGSMTASGLMGVNMGASDVQKGKWHEI
jgi:hypothetical protein